MEKKNGWRRKKAKKKKMCSSIKRKCKVKNKKNEDSERKNVKTERKERWILYEMPTATKKKEEKITKSIKIDSKYNSIKKMKKEK